MCEIKKQIGYTDNRIREKKDKEWERKRKKLDRKWERKAAISCQYTGNFDHIIYYERFT